MDTVFDKELLAKESWNEPFVRVLIVEDNPGDVIIITELLKSTGIKYSLTHVSSLQKALSLRIDDEFDVVLLDLSLPDSTGLETFRKIQAYSFIPPVVIMTGLDDEETALESLRAGAQDYLIKNRLTPENILMSIKYGIERKKLENLQKKNSRQFSILSNATASLNETEDISLMYSGICDYISMLLDNACVISVEFNNRMVFYASNNDRFDPWLKKIRLLTGLELKELIFLIIHQRRNVPDLFSEVVIHEIKGGSCELFEGYIDSKSCAELNDIIGSPNIYSIGFLKNENHYGGALVFSKSTIADEDIKIIETLCLQASMSIYRKSIKSDLSLSESRYRKLSEELEQKVKDRTRDLESVVWRLNQELIERKIVEEELKKSESQLIELNATKDKFFNILAHDLKNPFTSLLGSTELLLDNIHLMDNEKIRKLAQILNESAKRGYEILLNLLDWSRSQTGLIRYNPERINLAKLIDENISNIRLFAENKKIELLTETQEDIYLYSDKNMINTVLRNLLSNAIKFTPGGGKVVVRSFFIGNVVRISVKDNGIGISEDEISKLFRLDTKHTRPGTDNEQGTGLGLKLSKEFVEKQGGEIWVNSTLYKGSEFIFSVPVNEIH
jgi:signal transduction histidine kinase/DNA-binding NarL/FixJ family response regulator